jgi:hypothetical protein
MQRQLLPAVVLGLLIPNLVQAETGKVSYDEATPGQGDSIVETDQPMVLRTKKLLRVWEPLDPTVNYVVNSPVVFMHRCVGTSCSVLSGTTNSTTNRSSIGSGTLSAFSRGDTVWNNTMDCMREVFEPFGVTVTDQDPGSAPHYEIMIGGTPGQLGFDSGIGGVSPFTCTGIPNSLVFVFDVWGNNSDEICATAAQEVAHSWALDHSTDPSDPMSYFGFTGRRHFKNANVACGSDCELDQNGTPRGPQGEICSGTANQVRACSCGGGTQNTFQMVRDLFGDGTPTPPVVAITNPKLGQSVQAGFPVTVTITDSSEIVKAELYVNNKLAMTLNGPPFVFEAPDDLTEGTQTVRVQGYDIFNTMGMAQVQVTIGPPCGSPSDCPNGTDTCIGGRCVPGPGIEGGLGTPCAGQADCASGMCAMTTEGSYCVEQCLLAADQCPEGFGCLDTGAGDGNGVCFPGYDDSGGCLNAGGGSGPITVGLAFAVLLFVRRRRS